MIYTWKHQEFFKSCRIITLDKVIIGYSNILYDFVSFAVKHERQYTVKTTHSNFKLCPRWHLQIAFIWLKSASIWLNKYVLMWRPLIPNSTPRLPESDVDSFLWNTFVHLMDLRRSILTTHSLHSKFRSAYVLGSFLWPWVAMATANGNLAIPSVSSQLRQEKTLNYCLLYVTLLNLKTWRRKRFFEIN